MSSLAQHVVNLSRAVGWPSTISVLARRALKNSNSVVVTAGLNRLNVRPVDSDLFVVGQIFGGKEYDLGDDVWAKVNDIAQAWVADGVTPLILDLGANVGYSALYFGKKCPQATVVAVEADRRTYDFMCTNLEGQTNIQAVHAAVWNHEDGVDFGSTEVFGSWAGRVGDGVGSLKTPSRLLSSIIADIPNARVLIVKLDVEGAEREICEANPEVFRDAPVIMIEPHDFMLPGAGCLAPLYAAVAGRRVDTLIKGENLFLVDSALLGRASS